MKKRKNELFSRKGHVGRGRGPKEAFFQYPCGYLRVAKKMKRRESEEACGEENTRKRKLEENKLKN